jgi:hypothetical protein
MLSHTHRTHSVYRESADFYGKLYRNRRPHVPGALATTAFMQAVCGAFGAHLPDGCEIRITMRHGPGDHTYFDVQSLYVPPYAYTHTAFTHVTLAMT